MTLQEPHLLFNEALFDVIFILVIASFMKLIS